MTDERKNPDRHAERRWAVQLPARYKSAFVELATENGQHSSELLAKVIDQYLKRHGKEVK